MFKIKHLLSLHRLITHYQLVCLNSYFVNIIHIDITSRVQMGCVGLLYMYSDGMSHQKITNVDKIYHCYHKNEESFSISYYAVYTVESQKKTLGKTQKGFSY